MIQKLYYFFVLCAFCLSTSVNCQNSFGLGFGFSVYKGDLSQPGVFGDLGQSGMAFNAVYRYQIKKSMRIRAGLYFGLVKGNDSASSELVQRQRNLSFNNNLSELSLAFEYNFSNDYIGGSPFSFYTIAGLGVFKSNPMAYYNGLEYELRPLQTENQINPYSLYNPVFLLGGGLEIELNDAISVNIELLGRITNFDYIDDVSGVYPVYSEMVENHGILSANLSDRRDEFFGLAEGPVDIPGLGNKRGNPNSKDYYLTAMINFMVRLNNEYYSGKNRKRILCPSAR